MEDPLWFLTRQWQFGEFEGDDAGSPIDARIAYETAPLDGYRSGADILPYDGKVPLEARVEGEAVPFDLMLHMQAARVFERLLADRGRGARLHDYAGLFVLDYDAGVAGEGTSEARAMFDAGQSFLFDAAQLIAAVRDGSHADAHRLVSPASPRRSPRSSSRPGSCSCHGTNGPTRSRRNRPPGGRTGSIITSIAFPAARRSPVTAEDHRGGDLDWHAFDVGSPAASGRTAPTVTALSFLPTTVRFAGMPSPRYWEMEDGKTDFGRLDVNTNDLARLLLAEYMLLFSNDWCAVPLALPVGSFTRIQGLLVTDVFGEQTLIRAADRGRDSDWQRWSMYRLDGDDSANMGLLLAPALASGMRSAPVEQVRFLRDEMANMVWAVEYRVASKLGEPFNPALAPPVPPPGPAATAARFHLGNSVPANWRPFIPAHLPGSQRSIRLQRARLPDQPALPLGVVLDAPAPYFVAEEEVPRAGRLVTRGFRRARWTDGATFLWMGRESPVGRGEGSSGLVFDRVEEPPPA